MPHSSSKIGWVRVGLGLVWGGLGLTHTHNTHTTHKPNTHTHAHTHTTHTHTQHTHTTHTHTQRTYTKHIFFCINLLLRLNLGCILKISSLVTLERLDFGEVLSLL